MARLGLQVLAHRDELGPFSMRRQSVDALATDAAATHQREAQFAVEAG